MTSKPHAIVLGHLVYIARKSGEEVKTSRETTRRGTRRKEGEEAKELGRKERKIGGLK